MSVTGLPAQGLSPTQAFSPAARVIDEDELVARREAVAELGAALREAVHAAVLTEVGVDELLSIAAQVRESAAALATSRRTIDDLALVDDWSGSVRMFNPVFGEGSAIAPPVTIDVDVDRTVHGRCVLGPAHEGPFRYAHGGVTAMLLDQIVGYTAAAVGRSGLTAALTVQYRRPVPLGVELSLQGEVGRTEGSRKTWVSARVTSTERPDLVLAEAEGLLISVPVDRAEDLFGPRTHEDDAGGPRG